ncbi:E3 ubiquitin-protein ligase RNF169 [Oryzias melastigma]|uniref:E3 ubiquitin-protein ligase RNF169 n=1 Tax=Oryzias melastigma TaxID=30732 RepID=UPI000CF7F9CE|nr:E3 ubiquitin-protein ligase RNF169 [Oryzias melastigma]
MAAADSAEPPGGSVRSGSDLTPLLSGSRPGTPPPSEDAPPRAEPPACRTRRPPGRRRADPDRARGRAGRRDCDSRKEFFILPAPPKSSDLSGLTVKLKPSDDWDESRWRNHLSCKDECVSGCGREEPGVLSDSENEEPISRRIRNISAFIRKTKTSSALSSGSQRSRSCTDPMEECSGKLRGPVLPPAVVERVGIGHSSAAGILLSSENSRSVSAPASAPDHRPAWRAVLTSSAPPDPTPAQVERSVSPESNDSISEELNHFKPIVCSPCTPPKRLADGRLVEPTIVKSTPRNLTRGLHKNTSYEASASVLQKWRQIELDRQNLKVNSKATLTSPVSDPHTSRAEDSGGGASRVLQWRGGDSVRVSSKRRFLLEPLAGDTEPFQKSVKIRVPAVRFSRGCSELQPAGAAPEPAGGAALFGQKRSQNSGFQLCTFVPKDSPSPRKDCIQTAPRRGKKRKQKTKHLDLDPVPDLRRSRRAPEVQQVQQDRALALKLQRQLDCRLSPNAYFLRSWASTQNRRRRGLRRSRHISKNC